MSAHSINTAARLRGTRVPTSADYIPVYRLDVVGADAVDVAESVGGWLFDRVMAGWDVRVRLTRDCDLRPLRILGVTIGTLVPETGTPAPVAWAVSARVLDETPTLCGDVGAALRRGQAEVTVWGGTPPAALENGARPVLPVQHTLSAAARAFKAQALAAAGRDPEVGVNETFRTGNRSLLLVPQDLSPV